MKRLFFLSVAVIIAGCNLFSKKSDNNKSIFYSDIDIFTMHGRDPLKSGKPVARCFEIDSMGSNKVQLTIWYTEKIKDSRIYVLKDNYWTAHFLDISDTTDVAVYEYFGRHRLVTLEFHNDSSKNNLETFTIYQDSVETIYRFKGYFKTDPDGDIDLANKFHDNDLRGKTIFEYQIRNDSLRVITIPVVGSADSMKRDTNYYKIGDHSIFWWNAFGR